MKRIIIAHQKQADLPIYLLSSGKICCGEYVYNGVKTNKFKEVFAAIVNMVRRPVSNGELNVSGFRYWDAMNIYEEQIARPWNKSIDAKKMEQLAIETKVSLMLAPMRIEFQKAVAKKWKRIFVKSNPTDPNRPTKGWHIFRRADR